MVTEVSQFIQRHWFILFYIGAAAIFNMPAPDATSGKFYRWSYGTLHTLANVGAGKKAWAAVSAASATPVATQAATPGKTDGNSAYKFS